MYSNGVGLGDCTLYAYPPPANILSTHKLTIKSRIPYCCILSTKMKQMIRYNQFTEDVYLLGGILVCRDTYMNTEWSLMCSGPSYFVFNFFSFCMKVKQMRTQFNQFNWDVFPQLPCDMLTPMWQHLDIWGPLPSLPFNAGPPPVHASGIQAQQTGFLKRWLLLKPKKKISTL